MTLKEVPPPPPQPTWRPRPLLELRSALPRIERDVTLVTHCSDDRLRNLEAQIARWPGPVSAAIFIHGDDDGDGGPGGGGGDGGGCGASRASRIRATLGALRALHAATEAIGSCRLDLVAFAARPGLERARYPVNAMRNRALAPRGTRQEAMEKRQ